MPNNDEQAARSFLDLSCTRWNKHCCLWCYIRPKGWKWQLQWMRVTIYWPQKCIIVVIWCLSLFCNYHNQQVVLCPVAGCTDSYVELQELRERKFVTMAAKSLPYAHHCTGTVHIKSPPPLCFVPIKQFATRTDFFAASQSKNGRRRTSRRVKGTNPTHRGSLRLGPLPY